MKGNDIIEVEEYSNKEWSMVKALIALRQYVKRVVEYRERAEREEGEYEYLHIFTL